MKSKLRVTIDIFSGRPNPVIELSGRQAKQAIAMLKPARRFEKEDARVPPAPTLGYRGMLVETIGEKVAGLPRRFRYVNGAVIGPKTAARVANEAFEDFICGSTGPIRQLDLGKQFPAVLRREIDHYRELIHKWPWDRKIVWPVRNRCACAPLYEPAWWNDGAQRQLHNNCYNYATNYRTDTFCVVPGGGQPGAAGGAMYTSLTCPAVTAGAVADDLIDSPSADNHCPKEGHLVALVIWPGVDFHWYRKGRNGYWSHKPGQTQATNLDNGSNTIADPRTADRGSHTDFCTFMVVMHGHVKIR